MSGVSQIEHATRNLPAASIGRVSLRDAIGSAVGQAVDDDLPGMAAELAYRGALVVLPFLLVLTALPSVAGSVFEIDNIGERLSAEFDVLLSKNSADLVRSLLDQVSASHGWTPLVLGLAAVLWAGTSTISALRKSLNRIYKFDEQTPFIQRKLRELALATGSGALIFIALVFTLVGPALLGGWNPLTQALSLTIAFALVILAVSLLYWLAPAGENTFRWITPGALIFGVAWMLFSFAFSTYLSRFSTLNHVYGSLGAMIALLIWLYGSNVFLLFGAELNSTLASKLDPQVSEQRPGQG